MRLNRGRTAMTWAAVWAAALVWFAGMAWSPPAQAVEAAPARLLCAAQFQLAGRPATPVTLPDSWGRRGVALGQRGTYRLEFTVNEPQQDLWALTARELTRHHAVVLNGVLISGSHHPEPTSWLSRPTPTTVPIPPALLLPGTNVIELTVDHRTHGRLSCLEVGPIVEVVPPLERTRLLLHTVPLLLNFASGALAIFIGLTWLRSRRRTLSGVVAACWFIASARHIVNLTDGAWPGGAAAAWLVFNLSVSTSLALAWLGLHLGGARWRRWRGLPVAAALALAACTSVPAALAWCWSTRAVFYDASVLIGIAVLVAVAPSAWRADRLHRALYAAAVLVSAGITLGLALVSGWMGPGLPTPDPYLTPLGLAVAAWALLQELLGDLKRTQTEAVDLEHLVAERTQALAQANAAKSRFLATASHDLRQPVVTIGLLIDLLRDELTEPRQQDLVRRVDEAVASMDGFLGGLLDLSRLEAGALVPKVQPVALQSVFDSVAGDAGAAARLKGLSLRLRPTSLWAQTDPVLLQQMLRNLVGNALRYTQRGGVLVAARRRCGQVWVQVWDTGIGIPADQQEAVFEELVQLRNPGRQREQGYGLGLAIVRRSAQLLGHGVAVQSVPGRGSCFTLRLPAAAAEPRPRATLGRVAAEQPLAGRRVVLLEDDEAVRAAMVDRLGRWGATVEAHANLASLRAALDQSACDWPAHGLLIADERLPDGEGHAAVNLLRAVRPDWAVLVVTGNTGAGQLAALQESAVPVLHKPFRAEALLDAIERAWPAR